MLRTLVPHTCLPLRKAVPPRLHVQPCEDNWLRVGVEDLEAAGPRLTSRLCNLQCLRTWTINCCESLFSPIKKEKPMPT